MLKKKQNHCQLVPVQFYLYTHTNSSLLGIIGYSICERISVFRLSSTKDRWNFKSTQHKHFLTRRWSPIITNKINGFPVSRILFILRKTHMLTLLSPFIYLFCGCSCCLLQKMLVQMNFQLSVLPSELNLWHLSFLWRKNMIPRGVHNCKSIATVNLSKSSA